MTPEERERTRRYIERLARRYRSLRDEVEEDVASTRGLSFEQRAKILEDVTRTAFLQRQWSGQPIQRDPPAPDFERIWKRLHRQYLESKGKGK